MKAWLQKILYTLLLSAGAAHAQSVLEQYVTTGIQQNANVLKQQSDYSYALWALQESKRMFGPSVDANGSYTRNFRNPIDLNRLGSSTGSDFIDMLKNIQSGMLHNGKLYFPSSPNQYALSVTATQNVYNPQLMDTRMVKQENSAAAQASLADFRAELEADIRNAYFQYLRAVNLLVPLEKAINTTLQTLLATEQLVAQQKLTKENLYRTRASLAQYRTRLANMQNTRTKAQAYFNFLLNRPLTDSIAEDARYRYNPAATYEAEADTLPLHPGYRLEYLQHLQQLYGWQQKVYGAERKPVVQLKATGGISGSSISFSNSRLPYGLLQLTAKWTLFNNGASRARQQQAYYQQQSLHAQYEYMQAQLQNNELSGLSDIQTQLNNYASVKESYYSAQVYFTAIKQKYLAGLSTILELTDAQNQLLQSEMDCMDWYYTLQQQLALYQKNTGKKIKIH